MWYGRKEAGKARTAAGVERRHAPQANLIKNTQIVIDQNFPLKNYRTKSEQQKHAASEGDVTWSTIQRVSIRAKDLLSTCWRMSRRVSVFSPFSCSIRNSGERLKATAQAQPTTPKGAAAATEMDKDALQRQTG